MLDIGRLSQNAFSFQPHVNISGSRHVVFHGDPHLSNWSAAAMACRGAKCLRHRSFPLVFLMRSQPGETESERR
eukprot:s4956_g2.t1